MQTSIHQLFGFRLIATPPLEGQKAAAAQSSMTTAKVGIEGGGGETGPVVGLHSSISAKIGEMGETGPGPTPPTQALLYSKHNIF